MTRRTLALAAGFAAAMSAPPDALADPPSSYAKACNHYENRARFRERGVGDFIAFLADSCQVAQKSLTDGASGGGAEAAAFLDRVVELFDTVSVMNFERIYGITSDPYAKPLMTHGESVPLGRMTDTGEFLIAHRMGLIGAFDAWAERSPKKTVALRLD